MIDTTASRTVAGKEPAPRVTASEADTGLCNLLIVARLLGMRADAAPLHHRFGRSDRDGLAAKWLGCRGVVGGGFSAKRGFILS